MLSAKRERFPNLTCAPGDSPTGVTNPEGGFYTKRKAITIVLAVITFILALGMTLYPIISNHVNEKYASEIYTAYEKVVEQADDSTLLEAKELAVAYNGSIISGTAGDAYSQTALLKASADYEAQLDIAGNGTMGYVEIPKIKINLPIYHGTNNDSLDRGVGHLLGSSLPVGGENAHSILTGHSGMASQKMFTDLEQLILGDVFYLHVLDETLAYQVDSIQTVLPYDTSLLGVTSGEDYCTLVTCTPYGVNTHRLLVRGTRIPYEEAEVLVENLRQEELPKSNWEEMYMLGIWLGILIALIIALIVVIVLIIRNKRRANRWRDGGGRRHA